MSFVYPSELSYGDKMLWAAVLRRAIFDFVLYKGVRSHRLEWQYAYRYLFSKKLAYTNGLNFEEVCDLFGWNPDYIRRKAQELTRVDIKRIEYGAFREVPQERDFNAMQADSRKKWDDGSPVPDGIPYQLSKHIRDCLKLKVIKHSYIQITAPAVRWGSAVA